MNDRTRNAATSFPLAACAEMLWRDKPIEWRASRLNEMGFGVGLWNWPEHDLNRLEATGATFTIMNGYLTGRLTDDEGAAELLRTARETAQVGKRLGVQRLNLHGTGLGDGGLPAQPIEVVTGAMWLKARDTLCRVDDMAARTSTCRSIIRAFPSDGQKTRWRWSQASIIRGSVSILTSTTPRLARETL
jgi:hydroxypyruvate isomerase